MLPPSSTSTAAGCHTRGVQNFDPNPEYPELNAWQSGVAKRRKETAQNFLPSDVITSILSRLTVKTITRFRRVCKHWCSLICDPYFSQNLRASHWPLILNRYAEEKIMLYEFQSDDKVKRSSIKINSAKSREYRLSNSVNGLICAYSYRFGPARPQTFILNPTTREIMQLPRSTRENSRYMNLGLGFDVTTGKYKIVRLFSLIGTEFFCEVLTLGAPEWRYAGKTPHEIENDPPIFLHGTLHWKVIHRVEDKCHCRRILTFDIKYEEFGRTIPIPPTLSDEESRIVSFNEYTQGHVCIVIKSFSRNCLEFWLLKDNTSSEWTEEHVIHGDTCPNSVWLPNVIGVAGDKILLEINGYYNCAIYSYDICSGIFQKLYSRARSGLVIHKQGLASPRKL